VNRAEEFEELRPLLFSIAYRILGSVSEAEDAVQETWLRYEASPTSHRSTNAFLSAVVTRISIDVLRSARVRREKYVGQWLPEPLLTDPYEDPAWSAELVDSVSMAALLLLERAVFVLRELLAADVQMVGDGGGKAPQWARGIIGSENVARVLASTFPWFVRIEVTLEPHEVNGQPDAIFRDRDNKVLNTWALDLLDARIQKIRSVINPDKLGHVGPVADAWAVIRERTRLAGRGP
jgi:Sigma-70 region 2